MNISGTDLFDQNGGMICANVRLRCSTGITSIDVFDQNVGMALTKLDSNVHQNHWYWFIWSTCG